ncbi:MAG: CoA transferase [Actinomycetes bacterium]
MDDILPLSGLKVVDATSNIAGPYGGSILGDLGAEVLKIETPTGDPSRSMAPVEGDRSAYFHIVNRNKTVETIDLKSEDGRARLDEHLADADVFMTNFLPDRLAKLGLDSDSMRERWPRLIIGNLSSYGVEGFSSTWPGYDATVQARTGIMHITGERDGAPVRTGVSVLDIGSGMWLAMGILAAIIKREKTGVGSLVETSLYETGVVWVSYHLAAYSLTGNPSVRSGSGHPTFSPYGIFHAQDADICIGVGNDAIFAKLAMLLGRQDLVTDPRFVLNVDRVANALALTHLINDALQAKSAFDWTVLLTKNGVPADVVVPPEKLFQDPQAEANKILMAYPDDTSAVNQIPGLPIRFDHQRLPIRKAAPHRKD